MTWQDILAAIREGKTSIPAAPNGVPLVAVNAPIYELLELMAALTSGYNDLVLRDAENRKRIVRLRQLAEAHFPADRKAEADGWVSTKDMLPTKSGHYMTYSSHMGVYPYPYSAKNHAFNSQDDDDGEYAVRVEFWYPSPMPPVAAAEDEKED